MDNSYPPEAWGRLGKALERRRGQLGYGHRQRGTFLRDSGVNLSGKTIARLERGERGSYPDSTVAAVESIYRIKPGSVEAVLRGGELTPAETQKGPARRYADPRLQQIWEVTGLPESVRLGMIAVAQAMLDAADDNDHRLAG